MTQFNIKRFWETVKWTAVTTRKEALTNFALMLFAFSVPFIWFVPMTHRATQGDSADFLTIVTLINLMAYLIAVTIGGCWIFNNMKTKEQRISFKLLPATDLEKFAARALYVTLVWSVMATAAYCLADLLRIAVCLITGTDFIKCTIPDLFIGQNALVNPDFDELKRVFYYTALEFLCHALYFWAHSLYVLGGTFFRRRQFVLTTLVHALIGFAMLTVIVAFLTGVSKSVIDAHLSQWLYAATAVFGLLGLFNWWLSYRLFKRMQVINNKWINL